MPTNPKLTEILDKLEGVKGTENGWQAKCPAHEGDDLDSISIAENSSGDILLHCHSKECHPNVIISCLGMEITDLFLPKREGGKAKSWGKAVAEYSYRDEEENELFQVHRFEQVEHTHTGDSVIKTFRQRSLKDGRWSWTMTGIRRVLYRLPEWRAIPGNPIFLVEGEKQVDYLWSIGLVATCSPMGAGKWSDEYTDMLEGRDVVVIPDNDPITVHKTTGKLRCVGLEFAEEVADHMVGRVNSVHVFPLPDAGEKWGLDDWLQSGHTVDELTDSLNAYPEWVKLTKLFDRDASNSTPVLNDAPSDLVDRYKYAMGVSETVGVDILGETERGGILCYSREHKKTQEFRDLKRLSIENLLQFAGPEGCEFIYCGRDKTPDNMYSMAEVRAAIATLGGRRKIENELLGAGVWQFDDQTICVSQGEMVALNGDFQRLESAECSDRVFDLNSVPRKWFDSDQLEAAWKSAEDFEWCRVRLEESRKTWSQWTFADEDEFPDNPKLLTGLIMATWIQSVWPWRPQVFILGETNTGKTTLFQCLAGSDHKEADGIFGPLALKSSNYTAAALHQGVGRSAKVVICDEFEATRYRDDILAMVRSAGRGDPIFRGTPSRKMVSDTLHQIFWLAATESGLKREVDQNRFIVVEIVHPSDDAKRRAFRRPTEPVLRQFGLDLLAIAIRHSRRAVELATSLYENRPPRVNDRVCESYAVPAAMWAAASGMDDTEAYSVYLDLLKLADVDSIESDRAQVLSDILDSQVRLPHGTMASVAHLLAAHHSGDYLDPAKNDALEASGVGYKKSKGKPGIFIHSRSVQRALLKDTEWKDIKLGDHLRRVKGAKRVKQRINSVLKSGWWIPISSLAISLSDHESLVSQLEG
jgi:hypothetical protein